KAGATYVPLDSTYPKQRLSYILEQADISLVFTQDHLQSILPKAPQVLVLEDVVADLESLCGEFAPV
ncbi:MAG: AMP-binding protein, partial [Gammaproteobacteria bacterium]|nr:AMP-binding protein [Gammaproteobacteria bacterium]